MSGDDKTAVAAAAAAAAAAGAAAVAAAELPSQDGGQGERVAVAVAAAVEEELKKETWDEVLERVVPAIVEINAQCSRSFDGHAPSASTATGFVVDRARGIVLTNRHVVGLGPSSFRAIFPTTQEEVELVPVYRDPTHDFGFMRFDVKALRFTKVAEIELRPEEAKVGADIRVVGNDAAERLQILSGTIGRLDRNCPNYGFPWTDCNTNYLGAASGTSGGSSGSPVVNSMGHAIAINAGGGTDSNAAFYLPLYRVKRALELIQKKEFVPRGTVQAIFHHVAYNEAEKLGLDADTQAALRGRFPLGQGVLVAHTVVRGGPAFEAGVQSGDVLVRVQGELLQDFVALETVLDGLIGAIEQTEEDLDNSRDDLPTVELEFCRGGVMRTARCRVQCLHALIPKRLLQAGDAIMHTPSYSMAFLSGTSVSAGVFVTNAGCLFRTIKSLPILHSIDGQQVRSLDDLARVFAGMPQGKFFSCRYHTLSAPHEESFVEGRWEIQLTPMCFYERSTLRDIRAEGFDGLFSSWQRRPITAALPADALGPPSLARGTSVFSNNAEDGICPNGSAQTPSLSEYVFATHPHEPLRHAMVTILSEDAMTFSVDGSGVNPPADCIGVVLEKSLGLVLTLKSCVRNYMNNVTVAFENELRVSAKVVYVHPAHNWSVVQYEVQALPAEHVVSDICVAATSPKIRANGCVFVQRRFDSRRMETLPVEVALPHAKKNVLTVGCPEFNEVDIGLKGGGYDGLFLDAAGHVFAVRARRKHDKKEYVAEDLILPPDASVLKEVVQRVAWRRPLQSRWLEAQLIHMDLGEARRLLGLPREWCRKLQGTADAPSSRVLGVSHPMLQTGAALFLKRGDLLLEVEGELVRNYDEVERLVRRRHVVSLLVLRDRAELLLEGVPTESIDRIYQVHHAISFGGCTFIPTESAIRLMGAMPEELLAAQSARRGFQNNGVFVSVVYNGSPGGNFGAGCWILSLNDEPIRSMNDLLRLASRVKDHEDVRIRGIDIGCTQESVISIRTNLLFWPTIEYHYDDEAMQWSMTEHAGPWDAPPSPAADDDDAVSSDYHFTRRLFPSLEDWEAQCLEAVRADVATWRGNPRYSSAPGANKQVGGRRWWTDEFLAPHLKAVDAVTARLPLGAALGLAGAGLYYLPALRRFLAPAHTRQTPLETVTH